MKKMFRGREERAKTIEVGRSKAAKRIKTLKNVWTDSGGKYVAQASRRGGSSSFCGRRLSKRWLMMLSLLLAAGVVLSAAGLLSVGGGGDLNGQPLRLERPESGRSSISVRVTAASGSAVISEKAQLIVRAESSKAEGEKGEPVQEKEQTQEERMSSEVAAIVREISRNSSGSQVVLPAQTESGAVLQWELQKQRSKLLSLILLPAAGVYLWIDREKSRERKEKAARLASIDRELPEFLNKLVLMMNAGLVLTAAFSRAAEGSGLRGKTSYFYARIAQMERHMAETNSSLIAEFAGFAAESAVRELQRIANILSDSVGKGANVTEKLERESELLLFMRKKRAEEAGRLAESKMTLPLVLQLLALVTVTTAPVLLTM